MGCITKRYKAESESQRGKPKGTLESEIRIRVECGGVRSMGGRSMADRWRWQIDAWRCQIDGWQIEGWQIDVWQIDGWRCQIDGWQIDGWRWLIDGSVNIHSVIKIRV